MFSRISQKLRNSPSENVVPYIPHNQRVYGIGHIHGRADLLDELHQKILRDSEEYQGHKTVVYLGDYIDRGEQSRQVIEMLLANPLAGFESVYLKGNHEKVLLDFIEYPEAAVAWLTFGGREALKSYGIESEHFPVGLEVHELARQFDRKLPQKHRTFIGSGLENWQCGNYYFVHAGIRPGIALEEQSIEDKLWIRDEFLHSSKNHGKIIVHGHSITSEPEIKPNRIGIDTGAFTSGVLTCLVLEQDKQRFLQTGIRS